jgi:hypothetical protein
MLWTETQGKTMSNLFGEPILAAFVSFVTLGAFGSVQFRRRTRVRWLFPGTFLVLCGLAVLAYYLIPSIPE